MGDPVITIEPLQAVHLAGALALSQAEKWPHRAQEWQMLADLGHGVVALADGEVVGTACATRFGAVAMLSMIIVSPRMRGRGLGRQVMEAAMQLERPEQWRLVATAAGAPLYAKLGFEETGTIVQLQGVLADVDGAVPEFAEAADLPALVALDQAACGMDRGALIALLLQQGRIAVLRAEGQITAWAARRDFGRGTLVGPVVAADEGGAKALISGFFAGLGGQFVRVDTPAPSGLVAWLEACGLQNVGGGTTMVRGARATALSEMKTFALAAQALG